MTDRELLELAAKAAGIELWIDSRSGYRNGPDGDTWNPLTDDGDALRLAVKLEIQIVFPFMLPQEIMAVRTAAKDNDDFIFEALASDPYAATRRAIVRAAAEIGKDAMRRLNDAAEKNREQL